MTQDNSGIVTTSEIFDKCWKVSPRIGIPTGDVVISKVVDGKKKTIETITILPTSIFAKFKQEARRHCIFAGTSFDRGFLIPETYVESLTAKLVAIGHEFLAGVPEFLKQWDDAVQQRATEETDPDKRVKILAAGTAKAAELQDGLYFRVGKFKILPDDMGGQLDDLAFEVKGLAGTIAQEIADDVKAAWSGGATQRIRGIIARVKTKVEGLAFINPKFKELLTTIDEVVKELPYTGQIEGKPYYQLVGLMSILSSPERILGDHAISVPEDEPQADLIPEPEAAPETKQVASDLATIPDDPAMFSMPDTDTNPFQSLPVPAAIEVNMDCLMF